VRSSSGAIATTARTISLRAHRVERRSTSGPAVPT
jgi:hypothetical protein